MITHQITPYEIKRKPRIKAGSQEHLENIYNRTFATTLNDPDIQEGARYKVAGKSEKGMLIDIVTDFHKVEWSGMKVRFLELWFPDTNEFELYHPSDLKRN